MSFDWRTATDVSFRSGVKGGKEAFVHTEREREESEGVMEEAVSSVRGERARGRKGENVRRLARNKGKRESESERREQALCTREKSDEG